MLPTIVEVSLPNSHHRLHFGSNSSSSENSSDHHESQCQAGILMQDGVWGDGGLNIVKAILLLLGFGYLLFGISIITDRIVAAMEVIALHKRTKVIKLKNGSLKVIKVPVWNPTVVTLTVFTIGTSAPEIFLPLIEVMNHHYTIHDVGPSLIVGSGAFHLFVIVGVCMASGRDTFSKPIKDRWVFTAQTTCAILAYVWIYVIVKVQSPGQIDVWEALMTLAFYPVLVFVLWIVSKRYPQRFFKGRPLMTPEHRDNDDADEDETSLSSSADDMAERIEERRKLASLLHEIRATHPEKSQAEMEEILEIQLLREKPKNAGFYRLGYFANYSETVKAHAAATPNKAKSAKLQTIGFVSRFQTCMEDCGELLVRIARYGPDQDTSSIAIKYETIEGKAIANKHYVPVQGTISFIPRQQFADIKVPIIDDDIFEAHRKEFRIKLSQPLVVMSIDPELDVKLTQSEITISILEDDHCGVFGFEKPDLALPDDCGEADIKVVRLVGAKGRVAVAYKISPGNALPDIDYQVEQDSGRLVFEAAEFQKTIKVRIIDKDRVGFMQTFYIELGEPELEDAANFKTIVKPSLGENRLLQVGICENEELKAALDRLIRNTDLSEYLVSESWLDQFREVFQTPANYQDKWYLKAKSWIVYLLSFPWRFLTALLPPPRLFHGWAAYLSLLGLVAFFSVLILDFASHLGCNLGIPGIASGLIITAFGLGLPDLFACRHATIQEKTADAAIGHITGANTGCVFLGIGLAWSVAALHQKLHLSVLEIRNSDLTFIVILYCLLAAVAVVVLLLRRLPPVRGELGGPVWAKILSACVFFTLWLVFVTLSILKAEHFLKLDSVPFLMDV